VAVKWAGPHPTWDIEVEEESHVFALACGVYTSNSQIEMRLMMHLAQCVAGLKLLNEGRDIHTETAAQLNGISLEDAKQTKYRYPAKTLGFGVIYGLSAYGLHDTLIQEGIEGYSQDDCKEFIHNYFILYPEVKEFQKAQARYADIHWETYDMWGRIRAIPEMSVPIRRIKAQGERQAYNMPVQSGAQGILKLAFIHTEIPLTIPTEVESSHLITGETVTLYRIVKLNLLYL